MKMLYLFSKIVKEDWCGKYSLMIISWSENKNMKQGK
jgi:hypothetical protein